MTAGFGNTYNNAPNSTHPPSIHAPTFAPVPAGLRNRQAVGMCGCHVNEVVIPLRHRKL